MQSHKGSNFYQWGDSYCSPALCSGLSVFLLSGLSSFSELHPGCRKRSPQSRRRRSQSLGIKTLHRGSGAQTDPSEQRRINHPETPEPTRTRLVRTPPSAADRWVSSLDIKMKVQQQTDGSRYRWSDRLTGFNYEEVSVLQNSFWYFRDQRVPGYFLTFWVRSSCFQPNFWCISSCTLN